MKNALYEKRTSPREIIHVLNLKKLSEELPQLIEEMKNSPSSFFGTCKAREILEDPSKILGMTDSRLLVIPHENRLYYVDFSFIVNFNPVLGQQELSSSLSEIYRAMGISQYMQEVEKKKIVEKFFQRLMKTCNYGLAINQILSDDFLQFSYPTST